MNPDLIYDVGSHNGLDTSYYLSRGFRVVAIDANPFMTALLTNKFGKEIESGRLVVLNCAVEQEQGNRTFWVSEHSDWSSLDEKFAKRFGTAAQAINIVCVKFDDVLQRYGIPFYLKIDIEGRDALCIDALARFDSRPKYLSWEASYPLGIDQLRAVRDLGYVKFKLIRQTDFFPLRTNILKRKLRGLARRLAWAPTFEIGSSGPFGEETPGRWQSWTHVAESWRHYREIRNVTIEAPSEWFDFHAAR